jgi:5-methylcytosine-specific restriction endonuclease McrA
MNTARELTSRLADLLRREQAAMGDFLVVLADFDRKRLWEQLGYSSLFSFLRRELKLSAGAAQYRKTAAELVQKFPEVDAALRSGDLCLSSVIELAKVISPENAREVMPRFFGLSARGAAFVAASIRPVENPPAREFVVTAVRREATPDTTAAVARPPDPESAATVLFRAPEIDAPAWDLPAPAPERVTPDPPPMMVEPLDPERARVHMTVSRRLLEKLEAARDALSHSHPGASRDEIIEAGLDLLLDRAAKRRGLVKNPRKKAPAADSATEAATSPAGKPRTRYVPAEVRRTVWKRDQGKCQWPVDGGGVCGSTHQVEIDHVNPFAKGGPTTVDRCRLLCRFHQDVSARKEFGDAWMDRFTRKRAAAHQHDRRSGREPPPAPPR